MKRAAIIAFTRNGCALACEIAQKLAADKDTPAPKDAVFADVACAAAEGGFDAFEVVSVSAPARFAAEFGASPYESLDSWTHAAFDSADALVFVSATGIAVRAIAPYVNDKFSDPAVVCIDERARYVVPLLSGHVGGANEIACHVAKLVGAMPVVSTATDVNNVFAVDVWAREQGLAITNRVLAKKVSAALLEGKQVGFQSDFPVRGALPDGLIAHASREKSQDVTLGICVSVNEAARPFDETLVLVPRAVSLGVGCRKGIDAQVFAEAVEHALAQESISLNAVRSVASIDVKAQEEAVLAFAKAQGVPTRFFDAEQLAAVAGDFSSSEFVRETVGVDNVCERAALAACPQGVLIMRKVAASGATVAAALDSNMAFAFPRH